MTCANPSISNWKKFLADCTLHWRVIVIEIENVVTRSGFTVQQVVTRRGGFLAERKERSEEKLQPGHMILGICPVRVTTCKCMSTPEYAVRMLGCH